MTVLLASGTGWRAAAVAAAVVAAVVEDSAALHHLHLPHDSD